mgnify:CR=1 FL=1
MLLYFKKIVKNNNKGQYKFITLYREPMIGERLVN